MKYQFRLLFNFFLFIISVQAQDGRLDLTFNKAGYILYHQAEAIIGSNCSIKQKDEKIVIGGSSYFGDIKLPVVFRIFPDGSLDSSFNNIGITHLSNNRDFNDMIFTKLLIQEDGKILALGRSLQYKREDYYYINYMFRFNKNGTLDTNFGNNGTYKISNSINGSAFASMCIQKDGKILLVQTQEFNSTTIIRLDQNGAIDQSFSNQGMLNLPTMSSSYLMPIISMHGKDHFLFISYQKEKGLDQPLISQFDLNGNPDLSFGNSGKIAIAIDSNSIVYSEILIDGDNDFFLCGSINNSNGREYFISKHTQNGFLNLEFNGSGYVRDSFASNNNSLISLSKDSNEYLIGLAYFIKDNISSSVLVRYDKFGKLSKTFAQLGYQFISSSDGFMNSFYLNNKDSYQLIGSTVGNIATKVVLLNVDNLSATINKVQLNIKYGGLNINNGIFAAFENNSLFVSSRDLFDNYLYRYNEDGSLDNSYNLTEIQILLNNLDLKVNKVLSHTDNKMLILASHIEKSMVYLFRINKEGKLDLQFGTAGYLSEKIDNPSNFTLHVIDSGRILMGCEMYTNPGAIDRAHHVLIYKYSEDGSRISNDPFIQYSKDIEKLIDIDIQTDQKIVVSCIGNTNNFKNHFENIFLLRFEESGNLDHTFGDSGIVKTNIESSSGIISKSAINRLNQVILLTNGNYLSNSAKESIVFFSDEGLRDWNYGFGKYEDYFMDSKIADVHIIQDQLDRTIVSFKASKNNSTKFVVARLLKNGSLDNTFGANGFCIIDINQSIGSIHQLEIDNKNRIIISGIATRNDISEMFVARINNLSPNHVVDIGNKDSDFEIFPNPNKGNFNVKLKTSKQSNSNTIIINQFLGKSVYSLDGCSNHQELSVNLKPGIYVLTILDKEMNTKKSKLLFIGQ